MNWKPALVGALVVLLAGFGVGLAVDRTAGTDTVTAVSTVTVATTVTAPAGDETPDDGTEPIATPPSDGTTTPDVPSGRFTYLSALEDEAHVDDVTLGSPPSLTIGHTTFANGMTADDLFGYDCDLPATAEYTVESRDASFVADVGWTADSDSSASAIFEVRVNREDGEQVYRRAFDGPEDPVHVSVPLHDVFKLILMWHRSDDDSCNPAYGTFGLGNAKIVGG